MKIKGIYPIEIKRVKDQGNINDFDFESLREAMDILNEDPKDYKYFLRVVTPESIKRLNAETESVKGEKEGFDSRRLAYFQVVIAEENELFLFTEK